MSSGFVRRVSCEDIHLVQNLIERCLQLYMKPEEVVEKLLAEEKIEPGFTELVWQKLEEENKEFFRAYYLMLLLKEQISEFNRLLRRHAELSLYRTAGASQPYSEGSHTPALPHNQSCYAAELPRAAVRRPATMQHAVDSSVHTVFNNGRSSLRTNMNAAVEMSAHENRIDSPPSILSTQSSSMGLMGMIKSEPGYLDSSYSSVPDGNVLEAHPTIGNASITSFASVDSNAHPVNGVLLHQDISSSGVLGQISRNFSLPNLTADFYQSSDIMENYPRCPYLVTANENFLERGEEDSKRLDLISEEERLSYTDFGSE